METVYIKLLESGITYVPSKALHISGNNYKIIDIKEIDLENDATSIWEFFPGDVVKCKLKTKKFMPDNKVENILVADQLISLSNTFPNRKIHQLIFLIVSNTGNISSEELKSFEMEIEELCTSIKIFQKNHPLVKSWLNKNCKRR